MGYSLLTEVEAHRRSRKQESISKGKRGLTAITCCHCIAKPRMILSVGLGIVDMGVRG